jgi:hypothetical protein
MSNLTSVKIEKFVLERLREQYPDSTYNEIFETIVLEENYARRQLYPDILVADVAQFIYQMKEKYPNISIRDMVKMCDSLIANTTKQKS